VSWKNRIVGSRDVPVEELKANPRNWRKHPDTQRAALAAVLGEVGLVQQVVMNQRTGHLIDGHLRLELALQSGEKVLPVIVVDLDEDEERLVLATLDPLGAMAEADGKALQALLADVSAPDASLEALFNAMSAPFQLPTQVEDEWVGMPEFEQEKVAFRTIRVHFKDQAAVEEFGRLIGQELSEKCRFVWHPAISEEPYGHIAIDE